MKRLRSLITGFALKLQQHDREKVSAFRGRIVVLTGKALLGSFMLAVLCSLGTTFSFSAVPMMFAVIALLATSRAQQGVSTPAELGPIDGTAA
jgi:uncharacterized membrane protein YqgA involved in biofilm formation